MNSLLKRLLKTSISNTFPRFSSSPSLLLFSLSHFSPGIMYNTARPHYFFPDSAKGSAVSLWLELKHSLVCLGVSDWPWRTVRIVITQCQHGSLTFSNVQVCTGIAVVCAEREEINGKGVPSFLVLSRALID